LPTAGELGWGVELKLQELDPADRASRPEALNSPEAQNSPERRGRRPANSAGGGTSKSMPPTKGAEPVLQAAQWDSQRNRQRRTILMAIVATVGVLLVVAALGFYLWERQTRLAGGDPPRGADAGKSPPLTEDPKAGDPDSGGPPAAEDPAKGDRANQEIPPEGNLPALPADDPAANNPGANPVGDPNRPGQASNPAVPNAGDPRAENPVAAGDGSSDEPLPAGFEAGVGGSQGTEEQGSFEDVMSRILGAPELTSEWDDPELRAWQQGATDPIDQVLQNLAQQVPTRRPSARFVKPSPRQVDVQRSLAVKLAGFRNPQARLPHLMATVESLGSLPVWIDVPRYQGAPVSLDETRVIEAVQLSLPEFLDAQLPGYGFSYDLFAWNPATPELVGFRLFPTGSDQFEFATYDLPWLAADLEPGVRQTALETFRELVTNYVAPQTWGEWLVVEPADLEPQRASGLGSLQVVDGRLAVVHGPHVHVKLRRLLQQLQVIQENQGQPTNWPSELRPLAVQEGPRLQTVVSLLHYQPIPLRDLFRSIYDQSDVTVLVDWPSLIEEGWTPDTVVPVVARNRTVENVVRELGLDMQLSLRMLSPDVVCLLSDAAEERMADLEVYPIADLVTHPREWPVFRGRLRRLLEQDFSRYPAAYLFYDADFGCIFARLPQSSHQRLQVYLDAARRP
jgi:hypothetical protein